MERAHREIKAELHRKSELISHPSAPLAQALVEGMIHDLNHLPRRSLQGKTACELFQRGRVELRPYHRRQRKEVYEWIKSLAARILADKSDKTRITAATAWRIAAEIWLQRNGVISVAKRRECYPISKKKLTHK